MTLDFCNGTFEEFGALTDTTDDANAALMHKLNGICDRCEGHTGIRDSRSESKGEICVAFNEQRVAYFGPAATFIPNPIISYCDHESIRGCIPASMTGWVIPKSLVRGVTKTGLEDGMLVQLEGGCRRQRQRRRYRHLENPDCRHM